MQPGSGLLWKKYAPAELILRFFVEAQEARQFPTVSLSTEVMQIAASLGARVDVDVECHCCEEDDMLLLDPDTRRGGSAT